MKKIIRILNLLLIGAALYSVIGLVGWDMKWIVTASVGDRLGFLVVWVILCVIYMVGYLEWKKEQKDEAA